MACCPVPAARPASPGCGNCSRSYPHQRQKSRKPNRPCHRRAHAVVVRWSSSRYFPDGASPEGRHGRLIRPGDHHDSPQRLQHDRSRYRSGIAPTNRISCTHHWKTRKNRCLHCQFCHRVMQIRSQKPVPVPQTHLYALAQPLPRGGANCKFPITESRCRGFGLPRLSYASRRPKPFREAECLLQNWPDHKLPPWEHV